MATRPPPPKAQAILSRAVSAHRSGDLAAAETGYLQVLKKWPKTPDAVHLLALVAQGRGDLERALVLLQKAVRLAPQSPDMLFNLGLAQQQADDTEAAEASFAACVRQAPQHAGAQHALGVLRFARGDLDGAEGCYRLAVTASPREPKLLADLAFLLVEQGLPEEAIQLCRRALQVAPRDEDASSTLGKALQETGDIAGAVRAFRDLQAHRPDSIKARMGLHPLLLETAGPGAAIACLDEILAAAPGHRSALLHRAVLTALADPPAAAPVFARLAVAGEGDDVGPECWAYADAHRDPDTRFLGSRCGTLAAADAAARLPGFTAEFGVRHGASLRFLGGRNDGPVHGFDSFEGLPEDWQQFKAGTFTTGGRLPQVPDNVRLHVGWFADTIPGFLAQEAGPARLLNIDCDLYSSTRDVLAGLAARIVPGTVIVFDEYFMQPDWRDHEYRGFQEAVAAHGWRYRYLAFNFTTRAGGGGDPGIGLPADAAAPRIGPADCAPAQ
ncbi:MAG: tetratricopeptide repeat protein [Sneathiellaceae bacterium]